MDLSQFTTEELLAIQRGDLSSISTDRLIALQKSLAEPVQAEPSPDQNTGLLGDWLTAFKQSAAGSTKAITDVAGAGNVASAALDKYSQGLQQEYSPATQAEMQRQAERMKAAEESGSTWEEIKAGFQNVKEAPMRTTAQALGSFVPYLPALFAGPVGAALGLSARSAAAVSAAAPRIMALIGTAQGAGTAKGAIYDAVEQAALDDGYSPEEAAKKADVAQAYIGENTDAILAGASLGYLASRSGAEKLLQNAVTKTAGHGVVKEIGKEMGTEALQGGQERLAANVALQREGKDTPTFQGVAGQAVQEGLAGALGAGVTSLTNRADTPPPAPKEPPEIKPAEPPAPTDIIDPRRDYADLVLERERLKATPPDQMTPEIQDRIRDIDRAVQEQLTASVQQRRAETAADEKGAKRFPGLSQSQADLFGLLYPEAEQQTTVEEPTAPKETGPRTANEGLKSGAPGWQYSLGLRGGKMDATVSMQDIADTGLTVGPPVRKWLEANVAGKTVAAVQDMVTRDPTLLQSRGQRAAVLKAILEPKSPEPAAYVEPPAVLPTVAPTDAKRQRAAEPRAEEPAVPEQRQPEPSVEVPAVPERPSVQGQEQPAGAGVDTGAGVPERVGMEAPSKAPEADAGRSAEQPSPLIDGQMDLPGIEPGGPMEVAPEEPLAEPEFKSLRDAIAAGVPTYQMSIGEPAPKERDTGAKVDPAPAVLRRLENAQTLPQLEAAMDELVRTIQNPAAMSATSRKALQDFVVNGLKNIPNFETALSQAEARVRKAPAAPQKIAEPKGDVLQRREDAAREAELKAEQDARKLEEALRKEELRQAEAKAKKAEADARAAEAKAKEAEAKAKEAENARKAKAAEPTPEDDLAAVEATAGQTKPEPDALKMADTLNNMPMLEAAQWAAKQLPKGYQRLIAQRVVNLMRRLEKVGAVFESISVTPEGMQLRSGALGFTLTKISPKDAAGPIVSITLNHPSNGERSGVTPEVLLHELVHAVTAAAVRIGSRNVNSALGISRPVKDLYALQRAVDAYAANRLKTLPDSQLHTIEQKVKGGANALRNPDEILAWGLTNSDMQNYLESIPYEGGTAWNKFVTFVRDLLGLPAKANTALAEVLRVADSLLDMDVQDVVTGAKNMFPSTNVTPISLTSAYTPADLTAPFPNEEKRPLNAMVKGWMNADGVGLGQRFRVLAVDSLSLIEHRLTGEFDGAVRNIVGKVNPMGLMRQAQDYTKLLQEYFTKGALRKDSATNLWQVVAAKDGRPPLAVYDLIDEYARQKGYTREVATREASRILEGVRLREMQKSNASGATNLVIHLEDAEIERRVKLYNASPVLKEMSAAMDESRKALVQQMVDVGRLTPEDGKAWAEVSGYVPFDRINEEAFNQVFSGAKRVSMRGVSQLGKLPELVGTTKYEVGNVFENYLNTMGWMVGQVIKSDANLRTLQALEDAGIASAPKRVRNGMANPVRAFVNGEERYWDLPSRYDVMAFADGNVSAPSYIRHLASFSNLLRKTITSLPPFALKQVTDDVQRAIVTSGVKNPWALTRMSLVNFGKYAWAEMRGVKHPDVESMGAFGLTGEYDFVNSRPADSILMDAGYKKRTAFGTLFHRLEGITRASDLAVRKAIYDQTLREADNDQLLALTRAREFINFRRRGASDVTAGLVATIPFFNAYIQGMDVLYRAATGKNSAASLNGRAARKLFLSRALALAAFSTMYAMARGDDDEYKDADLRTRDNNWLLPGGVKLPVPGELGALFKVIPERVVEYYKRYGTEDEQEAMEAIRTAFSYMAEQYVGRVTPVPQAVKPLLEAFTNHSFLTGRELEGQYLQDIDPSRRRGANQSELSIAIADFARDSVGVEISPILIDNTLRGYFGSVATHVIATTDGILNPDRIDRPLHKMAFLSNYLMDPVGTRMIGEFYDLREDVISAKKTLDDLAKRDLAAAEAYAEKHQDKLAVVSTVNATLKQISDLRAYRKYVNGPEGAAEMTMEEREATLEELRRYELELVSWTRDAKRAMAEIRKEMGR